MTDATELELRSAARAACSDDEDWYTSEQIQSYLVLDDPDAAAFIAAASPANVLALLAKVTQLESRNSELENRIARLEEAHSHPPSVVTK